MPANEQSENADLKGSKGVPHPAGSKEKAHGSEVIDGAPKMHRRKAGGGGS